MFLITGLGNPGQKYKNTRHNVGFMVLDKISEKLSTKIEKVKFKGLLGDTNYKNKKVILLKPHTYMNLSGESVKDAASFYKIPIENIIIIYDDMDLPIGRIRIRSKGSSAGHNGLKSIIYQMSSENFSRIKIGIGKPQNKVKSKGHVLGKFSDEEREKIDEILDVAANAALTIVEHGADEAMNRYNSYKA